MADSSFNVLVVGGYHSASLAKLRTEIPATIKIANGKYPSEEELKDVSALLIRSQTEVDAQLLSRAPNLQVIVTATSGFDHIDLASCQKRQIKVMHTPDANPPCAAEITLLLLLSMVHNMGSAQALIRSHSWKNDLERTYELQGKNLGLIGLGRVGRRVAQLARAFGMEVSAYDPYIEAKVFEEFQVERLGLTELFIKCPIISLHVPLTNETYRLINRATLETMAPGASIINASRGGVIDETELAEAIERGHVRAAALDVFETEPLPQASRLRKLKTVFTTPHIGGFSKEALKRGSDSAVSKLIQFYRSGETSDLLPPTEEWYVSTNCPL
ncbi:MAG: hydroxyacid dehydrogenase [Bdellovibrionales bacterium]|nr:hydroxyacid dehydrogenase [Bdellovibrionales bacterium]